MSAPDEAQDLREAVTDLVTDVRQWLEWHMQLGAEEIEVEPPLPRAAPAAPPQRAPVPAARPREGAVAATPAPATATPRAARPATSSGTGRESLEAVRVDLGDCTRCGLSASRTHLVYGVGHPNAPLLVVGEAPGANEDVVGEPFVGRAGQLLNRMLGAIGLTRADVYICNIVKCRPPGNRHPEPAEVAACRPFVERQIQAVAPRVILTVGPLASQAVTGVDRPLSALRLESHTHAGTPVVATWHPADLLRDPDAKRAAWHDLLRARRLLRG